MIIRIPFKCPDALDDAIHIAAENATRSMENEDADIQYTRSVILAKKIAEKWFRYREVVTLVIDTDEQTCIVEHV